MNVLCIRLDNHNTFVEQALVLMKQVIITNMVEFVNLIVEIHKKLIHLLIQKELISVYQVVNYIIILIMFV